MPKWFEAKMPSNEASSLLPENESSPSPLPASVPEAGAAPITVADRPLPLVTIDVFRAVSGFKFDQLAGFAHWAKAQGFQTLAVPDWREKLTLFLNRPV